MIGSFFGIIWIFYRALLSKSKFSFQGPHSWGAVSSLKPSTWDLGPVRKVS